MFSSKLRRKPYKCYGVGLYSRTIYLFLNFLSSFFSKKLDINKKTFFFFMIKLIIRLCQNCV